MSALTIASKASTGSTLTEVPGINSGVSHLQELGLSHSSDCRMKLESQPFSYNYHFSLHHSSLNTHSHSFNMIAINAKLEWEYKKTRV